MVTPQPEDELPETDSDVLYPKLLDAELMTHNKYRSKYNKGVLPYPQQDMHAQPRLIREFCRDVLNASVSMAKEVADTTNKRAKASGQAKSCFIQQVLTLALK